MESDSSGERLKPVEWYSVKEAAEYLGVSEPTIFRWMKENLLSFYKVGGATRFTSEGLNAVIEKTTGAAEAEAAQGKCASCGHSVLIEGQVQGSGRLYFHPNKAKFWVLTDSMVPTKTFACAACGHIQWHTDTDKLKRLSKELDDKTEPNSSTKRKE